MKNPQRRRKPSEKATVVTFLNPSTNVQRDRQRRVLDAIALKRRRPELSMSEAARQSGTTVKTIRRYAGGALQERSRRLDVMATDRIRREMRFLSAKGQTTIQVTNSREAT